jgi:hypothetical protein
MAEENKEGTVYQVKGDALQMTYNPAFRVNLLRSITFLDAYVIATPGQAQRDRIEYWAVHEEPPSAPTQSAIFENCQGWTVRVIKRLVDENIVQEHWLNFARLLQEPIH